MLEHQLAPRRQASLEARRGFHRLWPRRRSLERRGGQVAFARPVTDGETVGYLADVYVVPERRGRGLGRALCQWLLDHPDLGRLRRWLLGTADAHRAYRSLGFEDLPPERYMIRPRR